MTSVRITGRSPELIFEDALPLGHEMLATRTPMGRYLHADYLRAAVNRLCVSSELDDMDAVEAIELEYGQVTPERAGSSVDRTHVLRWMRDAPDDELLDFSLWNRRRLEEQQRALSLAMPELQQDAGERVERLIQTGLFPNVAAKLFAATVKKVGDFRASDSFDSTGGLVSGYCQPEPLFVGMSNQFSNPEHFVGVSSDMKRTGMHESLHALGFARRRGTNTAMMWHRGGMPGLGSPLEEAIVSHAVEVSEKSANPQPEVVIPEERKNGPGDQYPSLREMVGITSEYGSKRIPIELVYGAWFEPWPQKVAKTALRNLLEYNFAELTEATDPHAFLRFINSYDRAGMREQDRLVADNVALLRKNAGLPEPGRYLGQQTDWIAIP
jgi:hypothetical protein